MKIYLLRDPVNQEIRYIGKTTNLKERLANHIYKSKSSKTHCGSWIKSLISKSLKPIIEEIEECENWQQREIFWIEYYKSQGADLTNHTTGGEGRTCDGKSTIKGDIEILIPQAIALIQKGLFDTEIEKKLGLSKTFLSRARGGFIKYIKDNQIVIPPTKTKKKSNSGGWNKGMKHPLGTRKPRTKNKK